MRLSAIRGRGIAALGMALVLSACVSPPPARTAAQDAKIRKLAVLSFIDESGVVQKIGLTVFNNDQSRVAQDGALTRYALETMRQRVHAARPQWEFVDADPEMKAMAGQWKGEGHPWSSYWGKPLPEYTALMQRTGADAALVFFDTDLENYPGHGVGVRIHSLPGLTPRITAYAHVRLDLVDREGNVLGGWYSTQQTDLPAKSLGVTSDIQSTQTPEVRRAIADAMRDQEAKAMDELLKDLGY